MVINYIYALHYEWKPFYIGISINPVVRLEEHIKSSYIFGFTKKKVKIQDVSIVILEIIKSRSNRKSKDVVLVEQIWIDKYLTKGFKLQNKLIKKLNLKPCTQS